MKKLFSIVLLVAMMAFGLYSLTKASTVTVCSDGCDYTTISAAIAGASASDIITVSAGTYAEDLTIDKVLTITGSGSDEVTLDLSGVAGSGVTISTLDGINMSGMTITGFPDSAITTTATFKRIPFSIGEDDYDDIEEGVSGVGLILTAVGGDPSTLIWVNENDEDVSASLGADLVDLDLVLVSSVTASMKMSFYVKSGLFADDAAFLTYINGLGRGADWTIDAGAIGNNAMTYSLEEYTYNTVSGVTPMSDYQEGTPAINLTFSGAAFDGTAVTNGLFSDIVFSNNARAIDLSGDTTGTIFRDVVFTDNVLDLYANTTSDLFYFDNVVLDADEMRVEGDSQVGVKFVGMFYVTLNGSPLEGATVEFTTNDEVSGTLTTGADGYTPDQESGLAAYKITSAGNVDLGNPLSYTASGQGAVSSGTASLTEPDDIVTIALIKSRRSFIEQFIETNDSVEGESSNEEEIETISIDSEESTTIAKDSSVGFSINNENHQLTVNEIDIVERTVEVTIQSDPINIKLTEGETKEVDLDGDGKNDVTVFLEKIENSGEVKIKITEIEISDIVEAVQEEKVVDDEIPVEEKSNEEKNLILSNLPQIIGKRDLKLEVQGIKGYILLTKAIPVNSEAWRNVHFLAYGSPSLSKFEKREREGLLKDFKEVFGSLPKSDLDWDVLYNIAIGIKPEKAFQKNNLLNAKKSLEKNGVMFAENFDEMVNYRLRVQNRDLAREVQAINVYRKAFKENPKTGFEWALIRALAYETK